MTPISFWQYFDYISLTVLFVVISALIALRARATKELPTTISKSVASTPRSSIIFSIVMTIFFPLYYCFLWFWVGPYISAPNIFYVLLILAFAAELIFVWAPANKKTKLVHMVSAGFVGFTMLMLSLVIYVTGQGLHDSAIVSIIVFWAVTLIASVSLIKKFRKYTFVAELAFCTAFLMMISIIAHT